MKRYIFEVVIDEGNDEFWEELTENQVTGCDEVSDMLKTGLESYGINAFVKLKEYKDE